MGRQAKPRAAGLSRTRRARPASAALSTGETDPATVPHAAEPPARWLGGYSGPVLADSSPLVALFNRADHWHAPVLGWLRANPAAALVSTWPVAAEGSITEVLRISERFADLPFDLADASIAETAARLIRHPGAG